MPTLLSSHRATVWARIAVPVVVGALAVVVVPSAAFAAPPTLPGTLKVTPTSVTAGTANTYTLRFQANTSFSGDVEFLIPLPSTWPGATGSNSALLKSTCTISTDPTQGFSTNGTDIFVRGLTCKKGQFAQVSYGPVTLNAAGVAGAFQAFVGGSWSDFLNTVPVTVTPAAPATMAFTLQPQSVIAGVVMSPVAVSLHDAFGNSDPGYDITMGIDPGVPSGYFGGDTVETTGPDGVATFNALWVQKAGTYNGLVATTSGLAPTESDGFNVWAAAPDHLAFVSQPTNTPYRAYLTTTPVVGIYDYFGNLTSSTADVTLSLGNNPRGATLNGDPTHAASGGKATFPGLWLDANEVGATLVATSAGLPSKASNPFDITMTTISGAGIDGTWWQTAGAGGTPLGSEDCAWMQWQFWSNGGPQSPDADFCSGYPPIAMNGVTPSANVQGYVWDQSTTDTRALTSGAISSAGAWYTPDGSDYTLTVSDSHAVSMITLYVVDWDSNARAESITVVDSSGVQPVHLSNFHNGVYVQAPVTSGNVTINVHLDSVAGVNAVISGIFLN